MTILEELIQYAEDGISGKRVECQKYKWALQRFLGDIKRSEDGWHYVWNEQKAQRIVRFFSHFKHSKGVLAGNRITLTKYGKFSLCQTFAWVHKDTGLRRFRKVYKQVARKNAKSQELSGVCNYTLSLDGEDKAEIYTAAMKRDQAKIVYDESVNMAYSCGDFLKRVKIYTSRDRVLHRKSGSYIRPLSRDDKKLGDGLNPHVAVIDEYHAHPTSEIYDVLASGMGARMQPLIYIITTAGFDLANPCYRVEYDYVSKIINPDVDVHNDEYLVLISELDKDDDPFVFENLQKANPILYSYEKGREYLRAEMQAANDSPDKRRNYLTKHCNIWIQDRENGYMDMARWKLCQQSDKTILDFERAYCYVGVDLAMKTDLTSVCVEVPMPDGRFFVHSHSFLPRATLRHKETTDRVDYTGWAKQGYLTIQDADVTDVPGVADWIMDFIFEHKLKLKEVCADPWNCGDLQTNLEKRGAVFVEIRQGIRTLGAPTKHFREQVYARNVLYNENPLLNWAISNTVVKMDHNENIQLDKKESRQRIDPATAIMCSHTRAMLHYRTNNFFGRIG